MTLSKKISYYTLQLVTVAFYTCFIGGLMYFYGDFKIDFLFEAFIFISVFIFLTHGLRLYIIKADWFSLKFNKLLPRIILVSIVLGVLLFPISVLNGVIWKTISWNEAFEGPNFLYQISFFTFLFLMWVLLYFLFHYITNYQKTLKMTALMNEAELQNLKSQLNPHFLFNSLNSVRALIDEDPNKAKVSITALSNLLRVSLVTGKKKFVALSQELETVKDYLALEQIRYEERLITNINCAPETLRLKVPPLLLQTIVENAIKHGIANLKDGGRIEVKSYTKNERLHIEVRNPGQYFNGKSTGKKGLGLKLSKKRLELLFDKQATLIVSNETDNTVLTEIILPEIISHENLNH